MAKPCIESALAKSKGKLSESEITKILSDLEKRKEAGASPSDILKEELEGISLAKKEAYIERRNKFLRQKKKVDFLTRVDKLKSGRGYSTKASVVEIIKTDARNAIHQKKRRVQAAFDSKLRKEGLLEDFKDFVHSDDIALELHNEFKGGPVTKNTAAQKIAKAILEMQSQFESELNLEGANINHLSGRIADQAHDVGKIAEAGREQYISDIVDKYFLDVDGRDIKSFTREELDDLFDTLASGDHDVDFSSRKSKEIADLDHIGVLKGTGNIARKLSKRRKINIKPELFNEYSKIYGKGSIEQVVASSIDRFSRNYGLMSLFGDNPEAFLFGPKGVIQELKEATKSEGVGGGHPLNDSFILNTFRNVTGEASIPVNTRMGRMVAKVSDRLQLFESMNRLGFVVVSSISDIPIKVHTMAKMGMNVGESIDVAFKNAYGDFGDQGMKEIAESYIAGLDAMSADLVDTYRQGYAVSSDPSMFGRKGSFKNVVGHLKDKQYGQAFDSLGDSFFKLTALEKWTNNGKAGFYAATTNYLGKNTDRAFSDLNPKLKETIRFYGLEEDWDFIRKYPEVTSDGGKFLTPGGLEDIPDEAIAALRPELSADGIRRYRGKLQDKLGTMLSAEGEKGVLTPGPEINAMLFGNTQKGTLHGEFLRLLFQFKKFPLALMTNIYGPEIAAGNARSIATIGALATSMTVFGMANLSIRSILKGSSPPDFSKPENIFAATVAGGGLTILGEIALDAATGRIGYGRSVIDALAGPVFSDTTKGLKTVVDTTKKLIDGDYSGAGADVTEFTRSQIPGGNLFYTNLAIDMLVYNNLMEFFNPGWKDEQRMKAEERGQTRFAI